MSTPQSGAAERRAPNPRRRAAPRTRSTANHDETEQTKVLRTKYARELAMLQELFPDWSDEDLLLALQESRGEVELAVGRISEGHTSRFAAVKNKKQTRKEAAAAALTAPLAPPAGAPVAATDAPRTRARPTERAGERGALRGHGATPTARAGRGGFRGVGGRGGSVGGAPVPPKADAKPVTTTAAAFGLAQPSSAASAPRAQEKAKGGMSWAQIARPVEPKPAPAPVEAEAPRTHAAPVVPEPAIAPEITQPALVSAAAQGPREPEVPMTSAAAAHAGRGGRGRARQDAPVVMPGGASLDRLGVQFGSLNFMGGEDGEPVAEAGSAAPSHPDRFANAEPKETSQGMDAFKHASFGGAYGLGGRPQGYEHAHGDDQSLHAGGGALGQQTPQQGGFASSSIYNPLDSQRNYYENGHAPASARDERAPVQAQPTHGEHAQQGQPGMQQQFPNVMPYYYPYYMPNQFQHYGTPAGGFNQYQMYGQQPQHPSKPEHTQQAQGHASPYLHHGAPVDAPAAGYSGQTPPQHYQQGGHPATSGAYDAQSFGQRAQHLGGNPEYKLQGGAEPSQGGLPALTDFLTASQTPQGSIPAQGRGGAQNGSSGPASSPLDYRGYDAGQSPANAHRATSGGPGANAGGQPGQQQPGQQQHPAYYQQYAGNFGHQANGYTGYSYGRQQQQQPYWG